MSASLVQWAHVDQSAPLPADKTPQHIIRLSFPFTWITNCQLCRYLDIAAVPLPNLFHTEWCWSGSSRILYLEPRPKPFMTAKFLYSTIIKMTTGCIFCCGLRHIWFRPSGLWKRRIYKAIWFMFLRIAVNLLCSWLAKMSINGMSDIIQTGWIYCYCC